MSHAAASDIGCVPALPRPPERPRAPRIPSARRLRFALTAAAIAASFLSAGHAESVNVSFLYRLADFSGAVPYSDVQLSFDRHHDEIYAIVGNAVRVFNAAGMEIFHFDLDPGLGTIFGLAVEESGDLLLLTLEPLRPGAGAGWFITRCDYRGEPIERIGPAGLPPELESFRPNLLIARPEGLVLVSKAQVQAILIDRHAVFQKSWDLARLAGIKDEDRSGQEIFGFSIAPDGSMLFTIPTQFKVFVVAPSGGVKAFGRSGSAPGSFSVVADVVADDHGRLFVADMGRYAVLVFDKNLEFVTEFGSGAEGALELIRPAGLAIGDGGRLYVTQARDRGVAVFRIGSPFDGAGPQPGERP